MKFFFPLFASLFLLGLPGITKAQQLQGPEFDLMISDLVTTYVDLHQSPELSLLEVNTSSKLAARMRELGFEVTAEVGGTGVVCVMKNGDGPTVLFRTDMDALPVTEATGLSYASKVRTQTGDGVETGVMHACGHDMHMTVWLGTAQVLATQQEKWSGTIVFIGQPAEEVGAGAMAMLGDGLYERFPRPDHAIALHVLADLAAGRIGYRAKGAMASVDMLKITVHGRGGHGASPQNTIDPVTLSASLIMDFQTIVSRNVSPFRPAVVTVGAIHGGTKGNIIPDKVEMLLTLRTYDEDTRQLLLARLKAICDSKAMGAGLSEEEYPEIVFSETSTPVTYNDPELTERVRVAISDELGENALTEVGPFTFGEDFSRYSQEDEVSGVMFFLGTVEEARLQSFADQGMMPPGLHSPGYFPAPELSIRTGVSAMVAVAFDLLKK